MEIINLEVTNIQSNSVEISWRTSEPATTEVKYGEELAAVIYNHQTPENESYTFDHSVLLLDLKPATTYHLKAISESRTGERVESKDRSFNTLKENAEVGEQTADTRKQKTEDGGGFAALINPTPSSRVLGASSEKAPRLNPYADVLGQYDALTPTPPPSYPPPNFPYGYPNYQGGYPYPPVAVVYPPNYAPQQNNTQPQVLAQQAMPTTTLVPEPTIGPIESEEFRFDGGINSLLLLLGVIVGIMIAGVYWRLQKTEAPDSSKNSDGPKTYEFSIG